MVLVDTTVWVDFFLDRRTPHVARLESLIAQGEDICICGVVLTEVLQGIRDDKEYERTRTRLDSLLFLPMTRNTFINAADIYRTLRRKGVTIRKPVDCMIASVAMEHKLRLLHNDRDFVPMEQHCGLETDRVE